MTTRQYLSAFVGLVFALIMAEPLAAQQADVVTAKRAEAGTLFWQGKVLAATRMLRSAIVASPTTRDKVLLDADLLEMCGIAEDWACLQETLEQMGGLMGTDPAFDGYRRRHLAYYLNLLIRQGDDLAIRDLFQNPKAVIFLDTSRDPASVALAQLALHDWFVRKDNLAAAERSLATAMRALLAMDVRRDEYRVVQVLIGLMRSMRAGHQVASAIKLNALAQPFIDKFTPRASVLYAHYQLETARLFAYTTDYVKIGWAFTEAMSSIDRLDIADGGKGDDLGVAASMASMALAFAGKPDEAIAVHARHPMMAGKNDIQKRGSFASDAEFYFAVTDVFLAGVARSASDQRWSPLFDQRPGWKMDEGAWRDVNALRDLARATLAVWGGKVLEGGRLFKLAARTRLESYQSALRGGLEGFPLPSMLDQIILALGLDVATRIPEQDGLDLMLAGSELEGRSLRHALVDAAVLLDARDDPDAKRDAHAYIRLLSQTRVWELEHIGKLLAGDRSLGSDSEAARRYVDMTSTLAALKESVRRNLRLSHAKGLPQLRDLQRSLAPGNAYVTYFAAPSGLGKLCVTRERAYWTVAKLTPDITSDVKLLEFATTASYPPNPTLDAQFPVSSALHLGALLFGDLDACLRPGTHVTVTLPIQFAGVPLGALLREAPPRADGGYDLAKAHWLIRDFSFALVESSRQYLATTPLLDRPPAPRPYLGVGDPRLDKRQVAEVASRGAFRGTESAPNGLADLRELPETADELERVGALFDAADILIGTNATEAAFRAKPLADYDVIHFATHGLIREELAGLSEPALVLTPSGSGDGSRDGLLLASEIFDLTLNARLIVLSACNTAKYDLGQASLAAQDLHTAFTVAGAPTLLVSLWPIDSATARDLTVRFFREWRSPQAAGAADALARATRAFLAGADAPHQHPRFWAPFVVAGNGGLRSQPDVAATSGAQRGQGVGRQ
jgi:hypothetical protein